MHTGTPAGLVRKATVAALVALTVVLATVGASNATPAAAVQDPERNATTPTRWHFWVGQKKSKIDELAQNAGERVVDVNVDSVTPLRFSAVLVRNSGTYARTGDWSFGSEADVTKKINAEQGRLIDLEPFTLLRQAVLRVRLGEEHRRRRQGLALELRPDRQAGRLRDQQAQGAPRSISPRTSSTASAATRTSASSTRGGRREGVVVVRERPPQFVQQKAQEHGARLDRRRASGPRLEDGDHAAQRRERLLASRLRHALSRPAPLQGLERRAHHRPGAVRQERQRSLRGEPDRQRIGREPARPVDLAVEHDGERAQRHRRVVRHLRQAGQVGPSTSAWRTRWRYQPLSVLKLDPHLYVMDKLDKDLGLDMLDEAKGMSWVAPKNKPDEVWCPSRGAGDADVLRDASRHPDARARANRSTARTRRWSRSTDRPTSTTASKHWG